MFGRVSRWVDIPTRTKPRPAIRSLRNVLFERAGYLFRDPPRFQRTARAAWKALLAARRTQKYDVCSVALNGDASRQFSQGWILPGYSRGRNKRRSIARDERGNTTDQGG